MQLLERSAGFLNAPSPTDKSCPLCKLIEAIRNRFLSAVAIVPRGNSAGVHFHGRPPDPKLERPDEARRSCPPDEQKLMNRNASKPPYRLLCGLVPFMNPCRFTPLRLRRGCHTHPVASLAHCEQTTGVRTPREGQRKVERGQKIPAELASFRLTGREEPSTLGLLKEICPRLDQRVSRPEKADLPGSVFLCLRSALLDKRSPFAPNTVTPMPPHVGGLSSLKHKHNTSHKSPRNRNLAPVNQIEIARTRERDIASKR